LHFFIDFINIFRNLCPIFSVPNTKHMEKSLSILFYLRKSKKNKQGEAPIYQRITIDGKRCDFTTHRFVNPNQWDNVSGRVIGTKEKTRVINNHLSDLENKAYQEYNIMISTGKDITPESIRNKILGVKERQRSLLELFRFHADQIKDQIGSGYCEGTYKRYVVTIGKLERFLLHQYKQPDIPLTDLNHEFITGFDFFLRTIDKINHNTVVKYMKVLKKVVNLAVANEWIPSNPFSQFKAAYKDPNRGFLTAEELETIGKKRFSIPRLAIIRDLFLFSCYTGLSYSDIFALTPDDVQPGIDGEKWIIVNRLKTNERSPIPLLPQATEIINKYQDYPVNSSAGKLLPMKSNQKMNAYLKEIADLCGIKKDLSMHIGRHTFATTVTLSNGVPIETVSKMLGHTSIKTTQIYSKVVDTKISQDMKILKEKMNTEKPDQTARIISL